MTDPKPAFSADDRVELVPPYLYRENNQDTILQRYPDMTWTGTVTSRKVHRTNANSHPVAPYWCYEVLWDGQDYPWGVDETSLTKEIKPASDLEVEAAIASIMGAS